MTQEERLGQLIAAIRAEGGPDYVDDDPRRVLRGLMNLRPPRPVSPALLQLQDAFLQGECAGRESTEAMDLPPVPLDRRISLWRGDITSLRADAIVNAANPALLGCFHPCHSCIDNVIHSVAGIQLRLACAALMEAQGSPEPPGRAKLTPGFHLPARYVLHTVGPIVDGPLTEEHRALLSSCYRACLACAEEARLESVAFCCISTGVYHFPNGEAAEIAVNTVREALEEEQYIKKVIFNVFTQKDEAFYRSLLERTCP